jgi:hypothetical protein
MVFQTSHLFHDKAIDKMLLNPGPDGECAVKDDGHGDLVRITFQCIHRHHE